MAYAKTAISVQNLSTNIISAATREFIIIAHSKDVFDNFSLQSDLAQIVRITTDTQVDLFTAATKKLKPSKESGASYEISYICDATKDLVKLVIATLPTGYSRHNTASRSHAVTDIVKSNKGSSSLCVILIPTDVYSVFAQAVAVARPFSIYSGKSLAATAVESVDILIRGVQLPAPLLLEISSVIGGVRIAQRLVDTPPNVLHTDAYVAEATEVAARLPNCTTTVIAGRELEEKGFGGLWGVGKASEHLPALVVLSYVPQTQARSEGVSRPICLVGKGIVYDTGGLSIKTPGSSMVGMKSDMGGSAAVLGAFEALVKSSINAPVHALLCIAENSVDSIATRPDDIHTLLSGKTVEINNTDAEGRLVLADGCYYAASTLNAGVIIDIATLTGAQGIATGKNFAALYCNDEDLERIAIEAGRSSGDLTHPMPYAPEFFRNEFRSQMADMKNSVADRTNAQVSCAGQFIGSHIEEYFESGCRWLHIDMAYCACSGERATGYGVALLFDIVKRLAASSA